MEIREERPGEDGETIEAIREAYALKPMNCPHHHRIYASRLRSYRDLPLRLAEYGQVYRLEDSGAVSGLLRGAGDVHERRAHLLHRGPDPGRVPRRDGHAPRGLRDPRPQRLLHAVQHLGSRRPQGPGEVRRQPRGLGADPDHGPRGDGRVRPSLHRDPGRGGLLRPQDRRPGSAPSPDGRRRRARTSSTSPCPNAWA